jgi:ABC-type transport system substrate-binding protein
VPESQGRLHSLSACFAVNRIAITRQRRLLSPAISILLVSLAVTLLSGCHPSAEPSFPPSAAVLRLAMPSDVPTLDPAAGYDTASWTFEQMIFDTLVRYSDGGVDLVPGLATRWEQSPDSTVFTFHLRHDAHFSDGQPVVAADFKYEIERVLNPATSSKGMEYFRDIVGAEEFASGRAPGVRGIETPDPWTIVFRLRGPDPIFVHKLAMPFAAAVPRAMVARWGDDFSRHPVGSGPFMLHEWRGGQRLVLVRNPHYFIKGLPRLDAIVTQLSVNDDLAWLMFEAGEIDIDSIPPAEFSYVMKTPELRTLTHHIVTATTDYLGMNCQMPPFTDVRVRRAFNYAIDKRKLIAVINGRGVVARGVLPPVLPGYDAKLAGYPYDPAMARRLLEQAGLRAGFAPQLWLRADQTEMMIGQSIQQDLALVGVRAVLKPVAWPPLLETVRQPNTAELFSLGWEADFPDPENFLTVLLSKQQWGANNDTFFDDPALDHLLAAAAPIADPRRRYALYDAAERLAVNDAPWVFLYHPVVYAIVKPWVNDYTLNPMRPTRFERVWLSARPPS